MLDVLEQVQAAVGVIVLLGDLRAGAADDFLGEDFDLFFLRRIFAGEVITESCDDARSPSAGKRVEY